VATPKKLSALRIFDPNYRNSVLPTFCRMDSAKLKHQALCNRHTETTTPPLSNEKPGRPLEAALLINPAQLS